MPTLSALTINATKLNVQEIYEESISDPRDTTPATLEVLNGGLDEDNYAGNVPPWACQPGAFIRAMHVPFERWEFIYAKQLDEQTGDDHASRRDVVVGALSTRVFLPWEASAIFVGWQALWRHDASASYSTTGTTLFEEWQARFYVDGSEVTGGRLTLSPSRWEDEVAGGTPRWEEPGFAEETRWPYYSHGICIPNGDATFTNVTDKGYHTILCRVKATIYGDDPKIAKLIIPSGALSVIAVR